MHTVISHINEICAKLLDNSQLDNIPTPNVAPPKYVARAIKNSRRKMEDRHICIDDFDALYDFDTPTRTSYYAVFDGHAGHTAASYSSSHLHRFLAESKNYPTNPIEALKDAFAATDNAFVEKCKREVII